MSDQPIEATEQAYRLWRETRVRQVQEAIQAALKAQNCELRAVPAILDDGRIGATLVIVPL
jgi:hypothetical protein